MQYPVCAVFASTAAAVPSALGQWTATLLNPPECQTGTACAGAGPRTVGTCDIDEVTSAGYWTGGATSWTSLMPAGFTLSLGLGARGAQQVGSACPPGGQEHAALWLGSSASFVDLSPAGAYGSRAVATSGSQQVGATYTTSSDFFRLYRACLWNGNASSWVELHPPGAVVSLALGTDGLQQVGYVGISSRYARRAAVWSGSAGSFVDLAPPGSLGSIAYAVTDGRQLGIANFPWGTYAGFWTGTAASFTPLDAQGTEWAEAVAMDGQIAVGSIAVEGAQHGHAAAWVGPDHALVDLSAFLPGPAEQWGSSTADAVWTHNRTVLVAGKVYNSFDPKWEAVLWTLPLCGTADFDGDGDFGTDQDIESFFACLSGSCCATCWQGGSDFNTDGDFGTDADIESFFRVLGGGAC